MALPASAADQQTLITLLPHMKFVPSGVGGKPTVRFSGVNLQVVNGTGSTATTNGEGNVVLGYDENPSASPQTGSHDLVIGQQQSWSGYGELLAGFGDTVSGEYATALGAMTSATGEYSLAAGERNTASAIASSVTGGSFNQATSSFSSVTGGCSNVAGTGTVSLLPARTTRRIPIASPRRPAAWETRRRALGRRPQEAN